MAVTHSSANIGTHTPSNDGMQDVECLRGGTEVAPAMIGQPSHGVRGQGQPASRPQLLGSAPPGRRRRCDPHGARTRPLSMDLMTHLGEEEPEYGWRQQREVPSDLRRPRHERDDRDEAPDDEEGRDAAGNRARRALVDERDWAPIWASCPSPRCRPGGHEGGRRRAHPPSRHADADCEQHHHEEDTQRRRRQRRDERGAGDVAEDAADDRPPHAVEVDPTWSRIMTATASAAPTKMTARAAPGNESEEGNGHETQAEPHSACTTAPTATEVRTTMMTPRPPSRQPTELGEAGSADPSARGGQVVGRAGTEVRRRSRASRHGGRRGEAAARRHP